VHYTNEDGCFLGYRERRPRKGVCLDTPRLVGLAILDYAKCRMLDFHYNCMKKICKPLLLYTDTDSLMYLVPARDPYDLMRRAPQWFDFKNGKDLGWESNGRDGELGLFKYEFISKQGEMKIAVEYAGSESKTYAFRMSSGKPYLRCKGCPSHAAKQQIQFETVKAAALDQTVKKITYNAIRMKNAEAHHVRETKVAMRGKNDKVARCEPLNLPLGHWRVATWLEENA
jgi:hypothetical protein